MTSSSSPSSAQPVTQPFPSGTGRYAPSPSGDLHLGNLRTAILAWAMARRGGKSFYLRVEDLDRVRPGAAERQIADLAALGLDWEASPGASAERIEGSESTEGKEAGVLYQSTRLAAYEQAVQQLREAGLVYECFCTRREIQEASSAPHGAPGAYPGTCRDLSEDQREERRTQRPPALRLRAECASYTVQDDFYGAYTGLVDDFVLVRNDGTYAYNLTSVVDDAFVGVEQIVRGDDLLPSAPRQSYLAQLLGLTQPRYAHVPLALNEEGKRLAKRDGAVTLPQLREAGVEIPTILGWIAASIPVYNADGSTHSADVPVPNAAAILERFDPAHMASEPWVVRDL
ncbi:MAG: tRNA glutamyl-Q(34) synthetase GluQRS [Rothia mucilaginosa]|jgi:glutamyl-and glutaminyl-tRNA synthetase|uniref:tRNA glutamyl-Q(34) synthetase GluQRS n=1 Tax=Rothia TaxID=32207 RepID=UPI00066AAD58|nr:MULTISPECIES: tRNA glutamyl-Q(34) synthetase GluQRS [Rothia]MBS5101504.1 tRNA glutamyl-Q(34) synthetase GluQRS [Rothia mucilaginosa]OFN73456.1 tRNA glutamyl-Q synthetase [Rothia sp. HMSC071B01]